MMDNILVMQYQYFQLKLIHHLYFRMQKLIIQKFNQAVNMQKQLFLLHKQNHHKIQTQIDNFQGKCSYMLTQKSTENKYPFFSVIINELLVYGYVLFRVIQLVEGELQSIKFAVVSLDGNKKPPECIQADESFLQEMV
ncbi:unnamed protein product [Paramecium pentaurelia]|uniref:Uncharacterized protein n=1 Tax=Paramecium pentaurelia TaxID=43138 RepID=A0A8S1S913_9CILI|nr:unnamed protein product [Paramecium pentaurelia]